MGNGPAQRSRASARLAAVIAALLALVAGEPPAAAQSCPQLVARYDGSNWWWGAFGNCKRQGGPTEADSIFQCAWNQVPPGDQLACLRAALRGTDQTRRAIQEVIADNAGATDCCHD